MEEAGQYKEGKPYGKIRETTGHVTARGLVLPSLAILLLFVLVSLANFPGGAELVKDGVPGAISPDRLVAATGIVAFTGLWLFVSTYRYLRPPQRRYGRSPSPLLRVL